MFIFLLFCSNIEIISDINNYKCGYLKIKQSQNNKIYHSLNGNIDRKKN